MIRRANIKDIPSLVTLSHEMHVESDFAPIPFDPHMTAAFFEAALENETCGIFVVEHEDCVVGMAGGVLTPFCFSLLRKANDIGIYVIPEQRDGSAFFRLEAALREWAFSHDDVIRVYLGVTTGAQNVGALYERLGYTCVGGLYRIDKET